MKDINVGDPDFKVFTYMGLDGYIPEWTVRPDDPVSQEDIRLWSTLHSTSLVGMPLSSRREALRWLFEN